MANIKIDWTRDLGAMKPLHGVGQMPTHTLRNTHFHYMTEAGVPYSRLHDFLIMTAHCNPVDIPGMFPDFTKDPKDPDSYDFAFADVLVKYIIDAGVEPFWRLGVTFENFTAIKGYHVFPPKDPQKWAEICEGVIRHFTEGWANGFYYNKSTGRSGTSPIITRRIPKTTAGQAPKRMVTLPRWKLPYPC